MHLPGDIVRALPNFEWITFFSTPRRDEWDCISIRPRRLVFTVIAVDGLWSYLVSQHVAGWTQSYRFRRIDP